MADQNTRIGLVYALLGFVSLATGDAVVKTMANEWSPIAVSALRFLLGAAGFAAILFAREGKTGFRPKRPGLQVARGVFLACATIAFFSALFMMPLAETTALVFLSPIITALLSGPILKERVRPVTWTASASAMVGVVIILRPNLAEVGWVAFLPLAAALFISALMLANRAAARDGSPVSMQFFLAGVAAPTLIVASIIGHFSGEPFLAVGWPSWSVVWRCMIVAITASTAHWLVFLGTTRAGAATVAPMTYVQLLVAVALGWLWFGDVPDLATIGGATIIIGAGLVLWWSSKTNEKPISD